MYIEIKKDFKNTTLFTVISVVNLDEANELKAVFEKYEKDIKIEIKEKGKAIK